jgi:hypothetical protein
VKRNEKVKKKIKIIEKDREMRFEGCVSERSWHVGPQKFIKNPKVRYV